MKAVHAVHPRHLSVWLRSASCIWSKAHGMYNPYILIESPIQCVKVQGPPSLNRCVHKVTQTSQHQFHSFYQTWHLKTILNLQGMRNMFLIQLPTCEKSFIATTSGMWIILDSKLKSGSQLPSVPLCTERYVVGLYFDTNWGRNPMKQKLRQGQNLGKKKCFESCWIILSRWNLRIDFI